jgi:hypothetical protein
VPSAADLPTAAAGNGHHHPDDSDNQANRPQQPDAGDEPDDHQNDSENNHDDLLSRARSYPGSVSVRPLQHRHMDAANVIRRSQNGHGAESTRFVGNKNTNDRAGMGSWQ